MSNKYVTIIDAKAMCKEVTTVLKATSQAGKIAFLQLRDGSAFFQGVVKPNFYREVCEEVGLEKFDMSTT